MLLIYFTSLLPLIIFLIIQSKKIKEVQRQKAAWEDRLKKLNPVILRNVSIEKEVVSGKRYNSSGVVECDLFLFPTGLFMIVGKESWGFPKFSFTVLAKQKDDMLPGADNYITIQSISTLESPEDGEIVQVRGTDANYAFRTFTIFFHYLSDDHIRLIQTIWHEKL
jgi:hypothetical protein